MSSFTLDQLNVAELDQLNVAVRNIIASHLGVLDSEIHDKSTMESLGADSLDQIELIMQFEEEFQIEITDDDAYTLYDQPITSWLNHIARKLNIDWKSIPCSNDAVVSTLTLPMKDTKMKKTSKTFTVRGFNIFQESFTNPSGVIEDKRTFKELVANSQTEAIVAMLTDNNVRDLSVPDYDMSDDPKNILHVLDLTISLDTDDKLEVRSVKSALREVMKRWAEKSRIKNRRGWRSSAIKDPTFIYCQGASTEVKIQVILGNAAVYSDDLFDISPITYQQLNTDLVLLRKELIKRVTYFESLKYKHSIHGHGEVL